MAVLPRKISERDRIPTWQKIAFAAGNNMDYVATGLMTSLLWMPFFNIGLEISPIILGGILMVLRAWDAISDPVMGNISDNTRTRWGRRRPYMLIGAITTALLFPLIWYVPESVSSGESWLAKVGATLPFTDGFSPAELSTGVYVCAMGLIFFTSFTSWSMPYYGMQLELTPNYDERTRLTAWMTLFSKISSLMGTWVLAVVMLVGMLALGQSEAFDNKPEFFRSFLESIQPFLTKLSGAIEGEKPIVVGMRIVAWPIALCICFFGLLPAIFVKERYYAKETSQQSRDPFWKSIRESLRCVPLWILILISFFLVLGHSSVSSLGHYVNFYYVCGGDLAQGSLISGLKGTVVVFTGIALIPVFTWLGERFDKRSMVVALLTTTMLGHLLNYFLMTPEHPYWQIIPGVFESCAISSVWLFLPSMKADVADWDELHTHRRREGAINAFYSWFIKAALTASMGIGGFVLQFSGFDARLDHQLDEVVRRMFIIYLILPVVIWGIALFALYFYPLTRKKSQDIRDTLEARRGEI